MVDRAKLCTTSDLYIHISSAHVRPYTPCPRSDWTPSLSYFPIRASAATVPRTRRRLDFVALEKIKSFQYLLFDKEQFSKTFRLHYIMLSFIYTREQRQPAFLASSG